MASRSTDDDQRRTRPSRSRRRRPGSTSWSLASGGVPAAVQAGVLAVVVLVVLAGCSATGGPTAGTDADPESTTTVPGAVSCGTFGNGGVFPVEEHRGPDSAIEGSVDSRVQARILFEGVRANSSLPGPNDTEYSFVPREQVEDSDAVRDELGSRERTGRLYYFSPVDQAGIHESVAVSENGRVYVAIVGDC